MNAALPSIARKSFSDTLAKSYDEMQLKQRELEFAQEAADLLGQFYPGQFFRVTVGFRGGFCKISLANLMLASQGYILHLNDILADPNAFRKAIIQAGGELLERFNLPRGRLDVDAWLDVRYSTPLIWRKPIPE